MRIGILTGGGDVPGLNPAIKAVVHRMTESGHTVVGIRKGWAGLLRCQPQDPASVSKYTLELDRLAVRKFERDGGTFMHSSRTNPARVKAEDTPDFLKGQGGGEDKAKDFTPHILSVLQALKLDALVPIGGDDTLSYGLRLHDEGFPVVAIPKTLDNDVSGTDYCLGFATAISRSVRFITDLRTCMGSHERFGVIELFGRNSGETALISGITWPTPTGCASPKCPSTSRSWRRCSPRTARPIPATTRWWSFPRGRAWKAARSSSGARPTPSAIRSWAASGSRQATC